MRTTALAVELLVIGYQTLVWLALGACLLVRCDRSLLEAIKDWKELLAVASVVPAYTSGAIMNGITSRIMNQIEGRLIYRGSLQPSEMRAAILVRKPEAFDHIIRNFDVPRLLRSTVINISLIGLFSVIHLLASGAKCSQVLLVATLFLLGIGGAGWGWYETAENYYVHLSRTYDALDKPGRGSA